MAHLLDDLLYLLCTTAKYANYNATLAIIAMSFASIIAMHYFNIAQPYFVISNTPWLG